MAYKLDILAIVAHPDDAELACSGTLIKEIEAGKKVGIVDLTQGELGTRGSAVLRKKEAEKASKIMGLSIRENLEMLDGFFSENLQNLMKVVTAIRKYKPEIIITNAITDRHPDHGRGSALVQRASFLSGLVKIESDEKGKWQDPWRPKAVYHMIQDRYIKPNFVVDITAQFDKKTDAIKAFSSQFFTGDDAEKNDKSNQTPISTPDFMRFLESRAREFGREINVKYAEGYTVERVAGVNSLFDLL